MAGSSIDSLILIFNARISELKELFVARNRYPGTSISELTSVDASLTAVEQQVLAIRNRLHEEMEAIPKAKKLIEISLHQQQKLQNFSVHVPSHQPEKPQNTNLDSLRLPPETFNQQPTSSCSTLSQPKECKSRNSASLWYVTADELESLSTYMRGRLTLEKVNSAINDMASYAETNSQLLVSSKKLPESLREKALEIRGIAANENIKGKHFFLETDIKGPSLRLDNTGKAVVTVLRHLGRLSETRIRHHRVFTLLRPH